MHRHPTFVEVGFDALKDLLAFIVIFQQMPKSQDRGLVRDLVADQLDAGKAGHGEPLDQILFHVRIAQ